MKKKLFSLLAAAALCCGMCSGAFAAQEPRVGNVMLQPHTYEGDEYTMVPVGVNTLMMSFVRDDVSVGKGNITVTDDGTSSVLCKVDVQNDLLVQNITTKEDKGTVFMIVLPKDPKAGHGYRVRVEAGCFTSSGNGAVSRAIDNPEAWHFTVDLYGLSIAGHDINKVWRAGEEAAFDVTLCNHAARAVVSAVDARGISLETAELTESGRVSATVLDPENAAVKADFYGPDGELCGSLVSTLSAWE